MLTVVVVVVGGAAAAAAAAAAARSQTILDHLETRLTAPIKASRVVVLELTVRAVSTREYHGFCGVIPKLVGGAVVLRPLGWCFVPQSLQ